MTETYETQPHPDNEVPFTKPTAAEYDSWSPEQKDEFVKAHPGVTIEDDPNALEAVEEVPAQPRTFKGTPEAGLQRIRAAITLLESHSAAKVGGGLIGEALYLLEEGYSVLTEHHPANV